MSYHQQRRRLMYPLGDDSIPTIDIQSTETPDVPYQVTQQYPASTQPTVLTPSGQALYPSTAPTSTIAAPPVVLTGGGGSGGSSSGGAFDFSVLAQKFPWLTSSSSGSAGMSPLVLGAIGMVGFLVLAKGSKSKSKKRR